MFNACFQSIYTGTIPGITSNYVNSTAADYVSVDAIKGTARVMFKDGSIYNYTNVSRRAIAKFIVDDARSMGKFINNVLMQQRVKCKSIITR